MTVRNAVQPHLQKRPCRMGCGAQVPALNRRGQIDEHPICGACSAELDRQFKLARVQADRQWETTLKNRRAQQKRS
jgi:hypothetical protein